MPAKDLKGRHMSEKKPVPGYIWLLAGLVIGLFASFLVYLDKQPTQNISFTESVKQELKQARQQKAIEQSQTNTSDDKTKKPRFEFYTILSELEVFVPEIDFEKKEAPDTITKSFNTNNLHSKKYLLQAGSFKNNADAERLKASLAFLGVQASIQNVDINQDSWHRVRIGPFTNPERLRETLHTLKQNNIHAMTMELK